MRIITEIKNKKVVGLLFQTNKLLKNWKIDPQTTLTLTILALQHILDKEIVYHVVWKNIKLFTKSFN